MKIWNTKDDIREEILKYLKNPNIENEKNVYFDNEIWKPLISFKFHYSVHCIYISKNSKLYSVDIYHPETFYFDIICKLSNTDKKSSNIDICKEINWKPRLGKYYTYDDCVEAIILFYCNAWKINV